MGSSRLPGKVMMELQGRPMICHVVERVSRIGPVDQVVVATTSHSRDDELAALVSDLADTEVFRGSEEDVLLRYVGAAEAMEADVVVRVTADCPLLCPSVSTRVVNEFLTGLGALDYVSNALRRTYPRGLDTEAFSYESLLRANREATLRSDREHVTSFLWRQPDRFRLRNVEDDRDNSHWRLTVDTPEDFELVSRVLSALQPQNPAFDYTELLECLGQHPDWAEINQHIIQKGLDT